MTFEELQSEAVHTEKLDDLFEIWKKAHNEEPENSNEVTYINYETSCGKAIEKNSFVADGYISEKDYCNSKIKVLFVLREANIVANRKDEKCKPNERNQKKFYLQYVNDLKPNRPKQQEKMARMAFYLQHPDLPEEKRRIPSEEEQKTALKSSGYKNINKRGGGRFVDWNVFNNYYNKYKDFIERQIEIMNPDYIVLIGSNDYELFHRERKGTKMIKIWHTSYCMKGKKRIGTEYGSDKNVDCYMREFFNRVEK